MEGLVQELTRGNVSEVKIVLASVVVALAVLQILLMAVGYGKLRPGFLDPGPAASAHRAIGDAIVVLALVVATMCVAVFGFEEGSAHVVVASALLGTLALKVIVVRWWHALGGLLPLLGASLLVLFWATWATAAAEYLI